MSITKLEPGSNTPRRRVRLLSLDGGGIRGVSIITILKEIMRQINREQPRKEQLQPWQVFDLIGGTSTGGIIAIMLGCLRMTLDECEEAYKTLAKGIFKPKRSKMNPLRFIEMYQASERFDSQAMSNMLKLIIQSRTGAHNLPLRQPDSEEYPCKVFVTTVRAEDQELCLLRSYSNPRQSDHDSAKWELWEALRATSAANTFFDAHIKDDIKYVDGALKSNNPIYSVMSEADDLWDMPETLMVSIGTGEKDPKPLGGNMVDLAKTLTKTLLSASDTEKFFRRSHRRMAEQGLLYRFNVPNLGSVKLHDYKAIPTVIHNTQRFLGDGLIEREVARCSNAIKQTEVQEPICRPARSDLTSEEKSCLQSLHTIAGDHESQRTSIDRPVPGTCEWLLAHNKFSAWAKDELSSLLWITANPGCGKSVLSRFLIEALQQVAPKAIVCYFFFKNGERSRTESHQALCSLLYQLLVQLPDGIKNVVEEFSAKDHSLITGNVEMLWKLLAAILKGNKRQQVFLIVDALDECSENSRTRFIDILSSVFPQRNSNDQLPGPIKILVTSRPWPSIERRFKKLDAIRLRGEDEARISADIETMVKYKLREFCEDESLSPEAKMFVEEKLLSGADQTFLWVSLVFDKLTQLQSRSFKAVKKSLESIPIHLDLLYESAICQFQDKDISLKLLRLVIVASQPLHLDEINVVMNIDHDTHSLESLKKNLEPNMEYAAKRMGGFFIRIIDSRVHLVHQTAREFLLRCEQELLPGIAAPHVDFNHGEAEFAEASIRFLSLEDIPSRKGLPSAKDNLKLLNDQFLLKLPAWARRFYPYAAKNWGATKGAETATERNKDILDQALVLCDIKKSGFPTWWSFYVYKMCTPWGSLFWHDDPFFAHLTSSRGHVAITKMLLEAKSCNTTDQDSRGHDILSSAAWWRQTTQVDWLLNNYSFTTAQVGTALLASLRRPHKAVLEALLKTGIDVNTSYREEGNDRLPGAAASTTISALQVLLEHGLVVSDDQICIAARCGNVEILGLLLSKDVRDDTHKAVGLKQALQIAASEGFVDRYDLIIEFGKGIITEKPHIAMGLESVIARADEHNLAELLKRGVDASEGLKLASRLGHASSTKVLLQAWPYSGLQLNEALASFFQFHLDDDLEAYVSSKMQQVMASTDSAARLYNAFKIIPSFEQSMSYIRLYIERGATISPEQYIRSTSLAIALNGEFAVFLLENIRRLQTSSLETIEFLPLACLWGKVDVIRMIVSQKDTISETQGVSSLLAAIASGNPDAVHYFLDKGVDPRGKAGKDASHEVAHLASTSFAPYDQLLKLLGGSLAESPIALARRLGYTDIERMLDGR